MPLQFADMSPTYVIVRIYVIVNVIRRARLLEWIPPLLKLEFEPCAVEENNGRGTPVKQNSFDCAAIGMCG